MAFNTSARAPMLKASPFFKSASPRSKSPTRNEQSLFLRQVIGTTTTSNANLGCLLDGSSFALAAGSGAILYEVSEDLGVSQRFFHAKPTSALGVTPSSIYDSPTSVSTPNGARQRAAASLRESGYGGNTTGSPAVDSVDSPNKGTAARTKAVTCLALSPDGKLLALGETGHRPRVLLFSTSRHVPADTAQSALFEHTFGVRCLAFSPDSHYLASLGDMNDGFLHIWQIHRTGAVTLYGSNKCTSSIRQIAWMGNSLITCGTRHVKIWRMEEGPRSPGKRFSEASFAVASPSSRTLFGRPCLRGPLLDRVFTAVVAISPTQAIVCSDVGDICLLDDLEPTPSFVKIADAGFPVTAVTARSCGLVLIAGSNGEMKHLDMKQDTNTTSSESNRALSDARLDFITSPSKFALALGFLRTALVIVDSTRGLTVLKPDDTKDKGLHDLQYMTKQSLPGHHGGVLGIIPVVDAPSLGSFATWSADGLVRFWTRDGACIKSIKVRLEQLRKDSEDYVNELRTISVFDTGKHLISGDRFGVMRIWNIEKDSSVHETKAHGNEITSITVHSTGQDTLVATAGRDRTVQLFRWQRSGCEHIQTIEEHSGAVTNLLLTRDGMKLVTASSDRTIMIMDAVPQDRPEAIAGFIARRPITLKSTPCSLQLVGESGGMILVSTVDRHVHKYDVTTGNLDRSFKTTDQDGGDAVTLNSAIQVPVTSRSSVIAGVSSSDKSIRIYDETGRLLDREYGHTEGMTGIALLGETEGAPSKQLVTVASDGTIFVWDLLTAGQQVQDLFASLSMSTSGEETDRPTNLLSTRPPLRRVLSSSELTRHLQTKEDGNGTPSLSPTASDRPFLKRRASKLSMVQTPKLEPPLEKRETLPGRQSASQSPSVSALETMQKRRPSTVRPPSPSSARQTSRSTRVASQAPTTVSTNNRRRSKSAVAPPSAGPNALMVSTESIVRSLQAYRKKLAASSDMLALDNVRELEKELSMTAKVLAERSARNDTVMIKLLDQYSERLVGLLDEKIEASIARQMRSRPRSSGEEDNGYGGEGTVSGS